MVIQLSETAKRQIWEIYNYHQQVASLSVAQKIRKRIEKTIDYLSVFPNMGLVELTLKQAEVAYRSIVAHRNYKVFYRVDEDVIYITGIWDCRQDPQRMVEEVVLPGKEMDT